MGEVLVIQVMKNALLSVRDLQTWFELRRWGFSRTGYVRAVDGVSFDLRHGEAIAIVGESGCGKSTLARTILCLYAPTKGEVIFEGISLSKIGAERWYRTQVGFIQQDPYGALPPFMNVQRILEEPLLVNKVRSNREGRIRDVLEEVKLTPLEEFLPKFPHMLSGGQQQRLVIARAMILKPKLIVADEPVSMLDASVRVEILELLRKLQHEYNLGVIYITHDLSTVRYFSERILVMYAGKIVEKAKVDDLLLSPRHPYTQALLTATPEANPANVATLKEVPPGEPPSLLKPPSGCRFHPRCRFIIKELCSKEEPAELEPQPGHLVNCWLYCE